MIESILQGWVASAHAFEDLPGASLVPPEDLATRALSPRRIAEFTTGRHLASDALRTLSVAPVAVPRGPHRAPSWPPGVVGSITHCTGYRAAAVAATSAAAGIGIDADVHRPVPDRMVTAIAVTEEQAQVADLMRTDPHVCWGRLLFSLKESVYKAWSPMVQRRLGFRDACITIDRDAGSFHAQLLVPPAELPDGRTISAFDGRWLVRHGLVLATIVLPAA